MSTHSYYQAILEESPLFRRLGGEPLFHLLFAQLTILGPGPFFWSDLEADEVAGVLDGMTGEGIFSSRAQADRMLADIRDEIERAIASDPGIAHRSAYIEQVHEELAEHLLAELRRRGHDDRRDLLGTLLCGGEQAGSSEPLASGMPSFRLVPTSLVAEGAAMLGPIEPLDLFPKERWDRYPAEDYERWRRLYLEASRRYAAVLVLTA